MTERIRIGLIGAGIFARDAHVPALKALADRYEIAAVYSRTQATIDKLLPHIDGSPDTFTDLDALLARDDIPAVDVLMPINLLVSTVEAALKAGKHVISEKPVAPSVAEGRPLIDLYRAQHADQVWMVAENWRYEPAFIRAGEMINAGEIGRVLMMSWMTEAGARPGNKYYGTEWRRAGDFMGGFILDGGVHQIAALRLVMGEIDAVSAKATLMQPDIPPADTLAAVLEFERGCVGAYATSYAIPSPNQTAVIVVGERAELQITHQTITIIESGESRTMSVDGRTGIDKEFEAFADAIQNATPHVNTPEEALQDVAIVEAMLESSKTGERQTVERIV